MCGITGLWNLDRKLINRNMFDQFTDSLAHRGPDGRGVYIDSESSLALGHRRLAILDLSPQGHQPMPYANGRYWITYNGEIYNFLELRAELEGLGYAFRSDSDTEVILAAYAQWGEECQFKFNGMWAFAIWDDKEHVLFLSRDRFGVKPLHYFFDGKRFAFASEMKAFINLNWFDVSFDSGMVALALSYPNSVEGTENCLLKGVKRLLGGHSLTIDRNGSFFIKRWWNTLEHLEKPPSDYKEQIEKFRNLFFDACFVRMRSDVPIGTSLSGGLDSSSVLCAMSYARNNMSCKSRLAFDWQRAFIAAYPDTAQNEKEFALSAARHAGAVPVCIDVNVQKAIDLIEEVTFQFEEISGIHIGPWLVYREMRRNGVIVTLDGHGGDELLAGYHNYPESLMHESLARFPNPVLFYKYRSLLKQMYPEGVSVHMPGLMEMSKLKLVENIRKFPLAYKSSRFLYHIFKGNSQAGESEPKYARWLLVEPEKPRFRIMEEDARSLKEKDLLFNELYYDFHCLNLPINLRDYDRLSMSHGVEVRAPFLDWRLVCYAFSLPSASKIGKGFTKLVLRDAMKGILPEKIRIRKDKIGFANPLTDWVSGPLRTFIIDTVKSRAFRESDIWNGIEIENAVESACAKNDRETIAKALTYIQAMLLIDLFSKRAFQVRGL